MTLARPFHVVLLIPRTNTVSRYLVILVLFRNRHSDNVQDIAFSRIHSSVKMSLETVLVKRFSKLRKRRILNRHVNRLFYDPFILRRHFKENSRMTFQTETDKIFCDTCQI